jgi:metallophosphoesterase (TIGR03768 family)
MIYLAMLHCNESPVALYSPIMLYTTHVLDAAIQTVNSLHKQKSFDCGISLGDACNSTQYNELRWYIDVIDGKVITPSSGNHAGADTIDYQKPYKAAGLDKTIPWYQTIGNHDHIWITMNPSNYILQTYTGEDILQMGDYLVDPNALNERTYYMGTLDGNTPYGNIIGAGPVSTTSAIKVAADEKRRSLKNSGREWMSEFFNTSSNPMGHGLSQTNIDNALACYSFEPKSNMPIKVIVLDDTQGENDIDDQGNAHGSLDKRRYEWLVSELDKGQAEGKLMIVAAHVPIGVEPPGSEMGWSPAAYVSETDLIAKLHTYPNLAMWISGHRHESIVTPFKSPDPNHPELGFWEVETPSLRDFPQQFRTFEIMRNSDNNISIIVTDVDPAVKDGSPAATSRSYGVAAQQIYKNPKSNTGVYNAELIKQLSPEMQVKIQNYGTPIIK